MLIYSTHIKSKNSFLFPSTFDFSGHVTDSNLWATKQKNNHDLFGLRINIHAKTKLHGTEASVNKCTISHPSRSRLIRSHTGVV